MVCILLALSLIALAGACSAGDALNTVAPGEARAYTLASTAPVKPGLMDHGEDWTHLNQVLGYVQKHELPRPAVYLFGGSATRECTVNDLDWRRQIVEFDGPRVEAFNLGAMNESFDENIEMVRLLPDVPTLVIIGVNLGRYAWHAPSPEKAIARVKVDTRGVIQPYSQHRFTYLHIMGDARKRELMYRWLDERYPVFKANFRYNAGRLHELVAACLARGFHPVILNMPMNEAVVRHGLDYPRARVANNARHVAEEYGIPYVDFLPRVPFVSRDFMDLWHLVEPGRVKWQKKLSRNTVRLLDLYDITTIPTPTPSESPSPSPSPSDSASSPTAP
jgi:hypothetical protein